MCGKTGWGWGGFVPGRLSYSALHDNTLCNSVFECMHCGLFCVSHTDGQGQLTSDQLTRMLMEAALPPAPPLPPFPPYHTVARDSCRQGAIKDSGNEHGPR